MNSKNDIDQNTQVEDQIPDYKKGFNDGFVLETHNSKLASQVRFASEIKPPEYVSGFVDGKDRQQ